MRSLAHIAAFLAVAVMWCGAARAQVEPSGPALQTPGQDGADPEPDVQPGPPPLPPGYEVAQPPPDMPLTVEDLEKASLERRKWGRFVTLVGVLGVGMSLATITYEVSVLRSRSSHQYCSLGCEYNLVMGTFNGFAGLGLVGAGIGMLMRSFNLGQLAEVMRVEGPSTVWAEWLEAGKRMRVAGNFIAPVGSVVLAVGAALLVPAERYCGERHCTGFDEGDLDMSSINTRRNAGLVLAIVGGAMVIAGAALITAGYVKQHRVMQFRGQHVQPRVMLSLSPGGFSLAW